MNTTHRPQYRDMRAHQKGNGYFLFGARACRAFIRRVYVYIYVQAENSTKLPRLNLDILRAVVTLPFSPQFALVVFVAGAVFSLPQYTHAAQIIITSGTTWTVPTDWNSASNTIEVIGAGGGGGNGGAGDSGNAGSGGGAGGGGAYSKITNLTLTPDAVINIQIGTSTAGGSGGDTYFNRGASATATCSGTEPQSTCAKGGRAGTIGGTNGGTGVGGAGGTTTSSIGSTKFLGGNGLGGGTFTAGHDYGSGGGGGGGAGGTTANGTNGTIGGASTAAAPAGAGGAGGAGGTVSGGAGGSAGAGGNLNGGVGGTGSAGTVWTTAGAGGGAGGGGANSRDATAAAGNGGVAGNYGAGGGGGGGGGRAAAAPGITGGTGSAGKQGVIVITYTPVLVISGVLYSDEGSTPIPVSKTVNVVIGTSTPSLHTTTSAVTTGVWSISLSNLAHLTATTTITAWIDGDSSTRGAVVTKLKDAGVTSVANLNVYKDYVIVRQEDANATTTTNAELGRYDGDDDSDIQFAVSGSNLTVAAGNKLYVQGSTFAPGGTVTVNGNALASTTDGSLALAGASTFNMTATTTLAGSFSVGAASTFSNTSTLIFNATTTGKTITTAGDALGNVTFNGIGGAWTFSDNATTTNLTVTNGTITAPSSGSLSISGNYTNNSIATFGSGTVILSGNAAQTLAGTMTGASAFNNLTITNTSGAGDASQSIIFANTASTTGTLTMTASTSAQFLASATSTFQNINLVGGAGQYVWLRSSTPGTKYGFLVPGTQTAVTYVNVKDSNACPFTITADGDTSVDAGNNTCWSFAVALSLSGILYSDEGATPLTSGKTINIAIGTSTPSIHTTTSNGSGAWSVLFDATLFSTSTPLLVFVDADATTRAALFTKASSSVNDITNLDLYQNRVVISHEGTSGTSTTNTDLAFYDADNDADVQYTANGGALTVNQNQELHIKTGKTYAGGGAVTIHGNGSSTSLTDGSLHLPATAVYTAGGLTTIGGSFLASSSATFTPLSVGTLFTATTTGKTFITPIATLGSTTFNGIGGAWTLGTTSTTSNLTIVNGTLIATATISGTYTSTSFDTGVSGNGTPYGITYANGFFYIVDNTDAEVYKYTSAGTYTGTSFDTAASGNASPHGITYANGFFYVTDFTDAEVYKYTSAGTYTGTSFDTAASGNGTPYGITYANGFFYITEGFGAEVYKHTTSGTYTGTSFDTAASGNGDPYGITYANGFFYVTDNTDAEVYKYTSAGTYTGTSFDTAASGNANPLGITYANGLFYISDYIDAEVYKYNAFPPSLTIGGNYTNNGTFTNGSSTVLMSSTSAQTLGGTMTGTSAFNDIRFSGSGTKTFSGNASTSNFIVDSGATVVAPSLLSLSGDFGNLGTFTHNGGTLYASSSFEQLFTGNATNTSALNNISFTGTGNTSFLDSASTSNFTIGSTATVTAPTLLSISGNYTNGGRFSAASTPGISTSTGISFDTAGSGNADPFGITYANGFFYVADYVDAEVYKYTSSGTYVSSFDTAGSGNGNPRGITYANGFFYIIDITDDEVYKYTSSGTYTNTSFDTAGSGNDLPYGITYANGFFFVTDLTDDEVYKYTTSGTYVSSFDTAGSGNADPYSITYANGFFYVTDDIDDEVYQYTSSGTYTNTSFDTAGSGNTAPAGITYANGFFFVTDDADNEVYQYSAFPPSLTISGNYINNGTFTHGSSTVLMSSTSAQTLSGTMTGTSEFNDIRFAGGGTKTFSGNASTSSFVIDSGATVVAPTLLSLSGDFGNLGTFTHNGGTLYASSSFEQLFTGNATNTSALNNISFIGRGNTSFLDSASTTNFTIGATATVTAPLSLSVSGNYTNGGRFAHGEGTTTFDGAGNQIATGTLSGTSLFNKLRVTNAVGTTTFGTTTTASSTFSAVANATIVFPAGATSTFAILDLAGTLGNEITLRSSIPGTQWKLNTTGTGTVAYVDVKDSDACPGIDITASSSIDSGNNICWTILAQGSLTLSSAANQTFVVGQSATALSTMTVTDTPSPTITAANDIRISIATSTVGMRFDTTDTTATIGGAASGKVSTTVSYEGGGSVLVLNVTSDFTASDSITISGLSFTTFTQANAATTTLRVYTGGAGDATADATDDKTVTITGTLVVANHDQGQVSNAFSFQNQTAAELFAFKMTPTGESVTVLLLTFNLSSVRRIDSSNLSTIALYRDINANGVVDGGDVAVGGTGALALGGGGTSGTIQFPSNFLATTSQNYLVSADTADIEKNEYMTMSLNVAGTATGSTSLAAITPTGAVDSIQHKRGGQGGSGNTLGGEAPEGEDRGGGGQTGGEEIGGAPGFNAPTANGTAFNEWTNGTNAYTSDGAYATAASANVRQSYSVFGFSVPSGNTVTGIEVKLEASGSTAAGTIEVALSWNGDSSVTATKSTSVLTGTDAVYTLGSPSDTWGRTWAPSEFDTANFFVRVIAQPSGNTVRVDAIQVKPSHASTGGGGGGGGGGGEI